jgi:hypothetical protein
MSVIGKVSAVFTANSSGLVTGVNQAARSMSRMESATKSLAGGMRALVAIQGAQLFGSMAATAGTYIRSLVSMGQAQAQVIDRQSKLAARLGFTDAQLASVSLAGELAGVSMEQVAAAATKMNITLGKAAGGSASAKKSFDAIGLSFDDLQGMSPDAQFAAIAEAISKLPNEAAQAAAAVAIFGKAGANLLPMFQGGAEGIAYAAEQAQRLGLALTNAQANDVEAMNDAITLAGKAITGVVQQVVSYLAPAVKQVADTFTNLVGSIGGANIGQAIGDGILQGARFLAGIGDWLIENFSSVFSYFAGVVESFSLAFDMANRVGNFLYGVFKYFEATGNSVAGMFYDAASYLFRSAGEKADEYAAAAQQNFAAAGQAMSQVFATEAAPIAAAVSGPLTRALDAGIAQAEASAAQIEESGRGAAEDMASAVAAAAQPQALRGIDSRSAEGVAEMFRLMRGGDSVQEQQLTVLEQIAANTSGGDDDLAVEF